MTRRAAVGTAKGLFFLEDGEQRGPVFPGERIPAVAMAQDGTVVAASVSEHWGPTLRISDDFGHTWTEHDERAIAFPPGLEWTDHGRNETKPASVVQVWQLVIAPSGDIYAGTEPAALFKSTDGGRSFALVEGLWNHEHRPQWFPGGGGLGLHTILLDPRDEQRIHVAISTGGVYRSDDGGETWIARNKGVASAVGPEEESEFGQCVHKVDRDAGDPDVLFLQNHGGLYRSPDRGDTWQSIAEGVPSDFGFPLVTHRHKGDTAYVIPLDYDLGRCVPEGKARVYRTTDAGASWEPLGTGLPQQDAFLTVLRDGFCTDGADPLGLWFGTRSGHVFSSADEGEHWTREAEYLPDVLCVRAVVV
jgi:photosystem II stability/assembly factor-like uncharacterized protein